jgi:hypothetical protein
MVSSLNRNAPRFWRSPALAQGGLGEVAGYYSGAARMSDQERAISFALVHLAAARDLLKVVSAKNATAKVRAAITSSQNELERVK